VQHGQATQCQAALVPDPTKDAVIDAGNSAVIPATFASDDIVLYGIHVPHTTNNPGIFSLPAFSGYHDPVQRHSREHVRALFQRERNNSVRGRAQLHPPQQPTGCGKRRRHLLRPGSSQCRDRQQLLYRSPLVAIVTAANQQDIEIVHNDVVND
jgi:hypothetical protein